MINDLSLLVYPKSVCELILQRDNSNSSVHKLNIYIRLSVSYNKKMVVGIIIYLSNLTHLYIYILMRVFNYFIKPILTNTIPLKT